MQIAFVNTIGKSNVINGNINNTLVKTIAFTNEDIKQ